MHRRVLTLAAVLGLVGALGSGELQAGEGSFEELSEKAGELAEVVASAEAASVKCSCAEDEFKVRDCAKAQAEARKALRPGAAVSVQLKEKQLELGKYDFKRQAYPVSVLGELARKELKDCESRDSECDVDTLLPEGLATELVVTAGKAAWSGVVKVLDEQLARELRETPRYLEGEAVFKIQGLTERRVENTKAQALKAARLRKLAEFSRRRLSAYERQKLEEKRRCVSQNRTWSRQVVLSIKMVGLRLWISERAPSSKLAPEYLVSFPRSSVPLSTLTKQAEERQAAKRAGKPAGRPVGRAVDQASATPAGPLNLGRKDAEAPVSATPASALPRAPKQAPAATAPPTTPRPGQGSAAQPPPPPVADCASLESCRAACEDRSASGCVHYGLKLLGSQELHEQAKGTGVLDLACDLGSIYACAHLAGICLEGRQVPRDQARAVALLRKACLASEAWSCQKLKALGN